MAMDYWEPAEMEESNLPMDELFNRKFTPMVCGKCLGSHRTVDCGVTQKCDKKREDEETPSMEELFRRSMRIPLTSDECGDSHNTTACIKKAKNGEPRENWTMLELEDHYSSSEKEYEFLGYPHESQSYTSRDSTHFPWSENMNYHNWHDPYVHQEDIFGLPPLSPENHNQLEEDEEYISREEFEELKESVKGIEVAIGQLVKLMECQPQEKMPSQIEESPKEPTIDIHTEDEEEVTEEMNEEEDLVIDLEVTTSVNPILTINESNPDIVMNKKQCNEPYEQEEKFIKVEFVVEFLPEQCLKNKRQREIEFILKIQNKDRMNKRSRKEETTSNGSRSHKMVRKLRRSLGYRFSTNPGTMKENDPNTTPFDPGG